ncbi:hypothetical protein Fot_03717 [Forsythia ovata]|uniref:Uncharacterized protein n=1 Tax=Forsythia ovata TaxID=205694 RepID=A0ABD1XDK6_9LAMI
MTQIDATKNRTYDDLWSVMFELDERNKFDHEQHYQYLKQRLRGVRDRTTEAKLERPEAAHFARLHYMPGNRGSRGQTFRDLLVAARRRKLFKSERKPNGGETRKVGGCPLSATAPMPIDCRSIGQTPHSLLAVTTLWHGREAVPSLLVVPYLSAYARPVEPSIRKIGCHMYLAEHGFVAIWD